RELSIWSQLQHKGIVPLLGLALFRDQLAMVLPWNERGNVMKYIKQQPDLDRYVLCAQVVGAVVYLHQSGVIHGDLKGVNILVSDDGTLQLTDFGLAIMQNMSIKFSVSTNLISGTCRWMAPTSITESEDDSQAKLCKETDVYALGMVRTPGYRGKQPFNEIKKDTAVVVALSQGKRPNRP
ncbi:kinase-like protein, partial [Ceratobasidium sp. AG-I]